MRKTSIFKRTLALLLVFTLTVPNNIGYFAAYAAGDAAGTTSSGQTSSASTKDGLKLQLEWAESEFTDGSTYNLYEDTAVTNNVRLKVSYSSNSVREEGYDAGELIITVKGIGNVNRAKTIAATVGADKDNASVKTRDWSYTWNKANDTYTFTNNNAIEGNSVFSGYFELVWAVNARNSVDNYSQDNVQAMMYLPDGTNIATGKLSFSNNTKCDTFTVDVERGNLYSANGINGGLSEDDYVFIKYTLGSAVTKLSRGVKDGTHTYYFNSDNSGIGAGGTITYSTVEYKKADESGCYWVELKDGADPAKQYVVVAYPRGTESSGYEDGYIGKAIQVYLNHSGEYYEGNDADPKEEGSVLLAENTLELVVPADFDFDDEGGDYHENKQSFYEHKYLSDPAFAKEVDEKGGHIQGSKLTSDFEADFNLIFAMCGYIKDDGAVSVEVVDDFLYITQKDGNYRQLDADDYEFTKLVVPSTKTILNENDVPIQSGKYPVKVYAVQNGKTMPFVNDENGLPQHLDDSALVWKGLWLDRAQTVALPTGTTAVAIRYEGLSEEIYHNYEDQQREAGTTIIAYDSPAATVTVKFHLDEDDLEDAKQSNLGMDGQVVNTMFTNLYNNDGVLVNTQTDEDDYLDSNINLDLAQIDRDTYGRLLDRGRAGITFYEGEKDNYKSVTSLSAVKESNNRFTTNLTMGANFTFAADESYPNKFSLYTILPDYLSLSGYKVEEDIWDLMTLSGLDLSADQLAKYCDVEIVRDYKDSGGTYIALHFDFGSIKVKQDGQIRATFPLKVDKDHLKTSGKIHVRSAVVIDEEINEYVNGKVVDDGVWSSDDKELYADIDRDKDTEETLSHSAASANYTYADSSQFQLSKFVKTTYSDEWVQLPEIPLEEYGGEYQYKLSIRNGNSISSGIVVTDILETGETADGIKSEWQGTLQSVDLSACEALGLTGTVWYSASTEPGTLGADGSNWSKTLDPSEAKAIAIDFGDGKLTEGQELSIVLNMKAPADKSLKNKHAVNGYSVALTMADSTTGDVTKHDALDSNLVAVKLTPAVKSIIVTKQDAEDGTKLSGAVFELYEVLDAELEELSKEPIATATSNSKGYAIFRDIPADSTYLIRETTAPQGYELAKDVTVTMDGKDEELTIEDARKTGTIQVCKVNHLDESMPVPGAEYTLYKSDGSIAATAITDEKGFASFTNVAWDTYTVKETKSPAGYSLNETEYTVEINRENVSDVQQVDTANIQDDVTVKLQKYEMTTTGEQTEIPLPGATFELLSKTSNGDKRVGLYVTDAEGKIEVVELPYGEYFFREYRAPAGYIGAENTSFTLSPDNKDVSVTLYDQRKPGSLTITKKDNLDNFVKDVEFTLYDETKSVEVAKVTTNESGYARFDDLEWGTYYLLETDCPDYYQKDEEYKEVIVGANSLTNYVTVVNETKKGTVTLTKTDEVDSSITLAGAEYTLYTSEGVVLDTYTTDENGQLTAKNLEWGSYYFKETKAPAGYGLSDEMVRFSVNALNAGLTQEVSVTDPVDSRTITLTKRIKADDINFMNGIPTFIFKVEGTDVNGVSHTYHRLVAFGEEYVKENTDKDGYVSQSITISGLVMGEYTASEATSGRYYLSEITDVKYGTDTDSPVDIAVDKDAESVVLNVADYRTAQATFTNEKYENQDFSDNHTITNILKESAKLTSLKATYAKDKVQSESKLDTSQLTVTAVYDDGSTMDLTSGQYEVALNGEILTRFPYENGDYTITVTYEENGIAKSATFMVTISGQKPIIVGLTATNLRTYVGVGDELSSDMFEISATYNDGSTAVLDTKAYKLSPATAPDYECEFDVEIALDPEVVPNNGAHPVTTTARLTTVSTKPILITGNSFCSKRPAETTSIVFTDATIPDGYTKGTDLSANGTYYIDVSANTDESVVAWMDGTTMYVSSQLHGYPVIANSDSSHMFQTKYSGLKNLSTVDVTMLDTSNVTNMSYMFAGSGYVESRIRQINGLSNFDTSNVTDMSYMFFNGCYLSSLDLRSFDTSNVVTMTYMFGSKATKNNKAPTSGGSPFYMAFQSLDLSGFDTSNVTNMSYMFVMCDRLAVIYASELWSTSAVTSGTDVFNFCKVLVGGAGTKTNNGILSAKIDGGSSDPGLLTFKSPVTLSYSKIPVGKTYEPVLYIPGNDLYTITGYKLVSGEDCITLDTATGAATAIKEGKATVELYYEHVNGKKLTATTTVYTGTEACAVYSADDGSLTFYKTEDEIVVGDTYNGKTVSALYTGFDTVAYTSYNDVPWYSNRSNIKSVTVADKIQPANTSYWFCDLSACTSMDLLKLDTSYVTNMESMFRNCSALTELDLSGFDTSNVTRMNSMFYNSPALTKLNLSSFDTSAVYNMSYMFGVCSNLTTIYASDSWSTAAVTNSSYMFNNCSKLVGGAGTAYNSSYTDKTYAKIDGGTASKGYFTSPISLSYAVAPIDGTIQPEISMLGDYTITGYELVSGGDYITIDKSTGAVTGIAKGTAVVKVSAETPTGNVVTAQASVYAGSFTFAAYSADDGSLTFYEATSTIPVVGQAYNGKTVTAIYTGFDTATYASNGAVPWYSNRGNIKSVAVADELKPVSTARWFYGMTACTNMDLSKLDTSDVTSMTYMFYNCSALESLDLSGFDTSKVTNTNRMFYGCSALATIFVSDAWSVDAVTNSANMFRSCYSLVGGAGTVFNDEIYDATYAKADQGPSAPGYLTGPVTLNYDVISVGNTASPNVTVRDGYTITGYEVVSGEEHIKINTKTGVVRGISDGEAVVKVSAVNSDGIVGSVQAKVYVGAIAIYSADDHSLTFYNRSDSIILGGTYDGKKVTAIYTGIESTDFEFDMDEWAPGVPWWQDGTYENIESVVFADEVSPVNTAGWFKDMYNCTSMDLEKLNTENVTDMTAMFEYCERLTNLDVSGFDTSKVTGMNSMFYGCYDLTGLDLSNFDTVNVTDMGWMFGDCCSVEAITFGEKWNTANVTNMEGMFYCCEGLTSLDVSSFNTGKVTNMGSMFYNCYNLTELDVSQFDTSNVEYMYWMFAYCCSVEELDVSGWNTAKATDMNNMFRCCESLTKLDVSSFNTSNVVYTNWMFSYCSGLTELTGLSNWDVSQVEDMYAMFSNCWNLTELDISGWNTASVVYMDYMFEWCSSLTTIFGPTSFITDNLDSAWDVFYGCYNLVGGAGTVYDYEHTDTAYAKLDGGTDDPGYFSAVALSYDTVGVDETVEPGLTLAKHGGYTVTGYEIISGGDYITLDKATGAVTGTADGRAIVQVSVKGANDSVFTAQATVYVGSAPYAVYSADDHSLTFYKTDDEIIEGATYNNKAATRVYLLDETTVYTSPYMVPWYNDYTNESIDSVVFAGEIKPVNTMCWFYEMYNCTSMDLTNLNTKYVTDMSWMFSNCESLTELDLSGFDTGNVTDMSYMFNGCSALTDLNLIVKGVTGDTTVYSNDAMAFADGQAMATDDVDLTLAYNSMIGRQYTITWDGTEYTGTFSDPGDTGYAFFGNLGAMDTSFTNTGEPYVGAYVPGEGILFVDVSGSSASSHSVKVVTTKETSKVENMTAMFQGCSSLTELDMSDWSTSNVVYMDRMFQNCSGLVTIYASGGFVTDNVESSANMFNGCSNLVGGAGTAFDSEVIDVTYAKVDGGGDAPGYFTAP